MRGTDFEFALACKNFRVRQGGICAAEKIPPNQCRILAGRYFKFVLWLAEYLVGVANADVFLGDCLNKAGFCAVLVEGNDGFVAFPVYIV